MNYTSSLLFFLSLLFLVGCGADEEPESPDKEIVEPIMLVESYEPQDVEFSHLMTGNNTKSFQNQTVSFQAYIIFKGDNKKCVAVAETNNFFAIPHLTICDEGTHFLNLVGVGSRYKFTVKILFDQGANAWYGEIQSLPKRSED